VHSFGIQVSRIRLDPQLTSGMVERVIACDRFQVPTTEARLGVAWRWSTPSSTPASPHTRQYEVSSSTHVRRVTPTTLRQNA